MSNKKVYLLYVLILGGCSNITHRHNMHRSEQTNNDYALVDSKDEKGKLKLLSHVFKHICNHNNYWLRSWITQWLIENGRHVNEESKCDPKRAITLFRTYMDSMLPNDLNAQVEDNLIHSLLDHLNRTKDRYIHAKTCGDAIADMAINKIDSFLNKSFLTIGYMLCAAVLAVKQNSYLEFRIQGYGYSRKIAL